MGVPLILPLQAFEPQPRLAKKAQAAVRVAVLFFLVSGTISIVAGELLVGLIHIIIFCIIWARCYIPSAAAFIVITTIVGFEALIELTWFLDLLRYAFVGSPPLLFRQSHLWIISFYANPTTAVILFATCLLYSLLLLKSCPRVIMDFSGLLFPPPPPDEHFPGEGRTLAG